MAVRAIGERTFVNPFIAMTAARVYRRRHIIREISMNTPTLLITARRSIPRMALRLAAGLAVLATGDARELASARKRFMAAHGRVFQVLGIMQYWWYSSDKRREGFVKMCRDPDVQRLTWDAYLHKRLTRGNPIAHVRVFFKDLLTLLGLAPSS